MSAGVISAAIVVAERNVVVDFAVEELRHFLGQVSDLQWIDAAQFPAWLFVLELDATLSDGAFAVQVSTSERVRVRLAGADAAGVLHAMYTMLERIGFTFEVTGPRRTDDLQLERLLDWQTYVQPAVRHRGIRQHINFPMDISSYTLEEAKEYLRNLARLRFNQITFHSYPGQWYAVDLPNEQLLAGAFFYGQRHDIPDDPVLERAIRNVATFCIPEIEAIYDDTEQRSHAAIVWLRAVMAEAKRVGLTVQFSFELRRDEVTRSLSICDAILATYPAIDVLEIITEETADWGASVPVAELRAAAETAFGAGILDYPVVAAYMRSEQAGLDLLLRELGHAVEVAAALIECGGPLPKLAIGVYCVVPSYTRLLLHLMRRFVPAGVGFTVLAQHGNRAVVESLKVVDLTAQDWARSMIYSWIEFDGTMYLQQNSVEGIRQLVALGQAAAGERPINGICLNHWRTAENRTPTRYAALALLSGPLDVTAFYRDYAASLGLGSAEQYAQAMALLDDADDQARNELLNIGFCFVGVWGDEGLSYYGRFDGERVAAVATKYETALTWLTECAQTTKTADGSKYLAFLLNRVECTALYLRGVEIATTLQDVVRYREPAALTPAERQQVVAICDTALAQMDAYMALHAQALPDRGCEGTLISFYYTPPAVLKHIRSQYGVGRNQAQAAQPLEDSPPAPMG